MWGRQEPQPKYDHPEGWVPVTYTNHSELVSLAKQCEEQGMESWYFSTPALVDEVRQAGYQCINDVTTLNHAEAAFWTDLKLEHGKPVLLPSGSTIVLYGTIVSTLQESQQRLYRDDWFERNWSTGRRR